MLHDNIIYSLRSLIVEAELFGTQSKKKMFKVLSETHKNMCIFHFHMSHKNMGISFYEKSYPNLLPLYIKLFTTYTTIKTLF